MIYRFDELAKTLASPMGRREALWRVSSLLTGSLLGSIGFTSRAEAELQFNCNQYCKTKFPKLQDQTRCKQRCLTCPSVSQLCGSSAATLKCCTPVPHATVGCVSNACAILSCNAGFLNCNGTYSDGCETDATSVSTCGSCTNSCFVANGTAACSGGSCTVASCNFGFGNCGGGVCTPLNTVSHCGTCGNTCGAVPNATVVACQAGACQIAACNAGFADCNLFYNDGCEAVLATDQNNRGSCGHMCLGTETCFGALLPTTCFNGAQDDLESAIDCGETV